MFVIKGNFYNVALFVKHVKEFKITAIEVSSGLQKVQRNNYNSMEALFCVERKDIR